MAPAPQPGCPDPRSHRALRCPPLCVEHSPDLPEPRLVSTGACPGTSVCSDCDCPVGGCSWHVGTGCKAQKLRTGQPQRPVPRGRSQRTQRHAARPWMDWMRGQPWPLSQDTREGQRRFPSLWGCTSRPISHGACPGGSGDRCLCHFLTGDTGQPAAPVGLSGGHWLWPQCLCLAAIKRQLCPCGPSPCPCPPPAVALQSPAPPQGSKPHFSNQE